MAQRDGLGLCHLGQPAKRQTPNTAPCRFTRSTGGSTIALAPIVHGVSTPPSLQLPRGTGSTTLVPLYALVARIGFGAQPCLYRSRGTYRSTLLERLLGEMREVAVARMGAERALRQLSTVMPDLPFCGPEAAVAACRSPPA